MDLIGSAGRGGSATAGGSAGFYTRRFDAGIV